jgi:hypothetical protein
LQRQLKAQGVQMMSEADENTTGPASFIVLDLTETRFSSINTSDTHARTNAILSPGVYEVKAPVGRVAGPGPATGRDRLTWTCG